MKDLGEITELVINCLLKNSNNSKKMPCLLMVYILSIEGYTIFLQLGKLTGEMSRSYPPCLLVDTGLEWSWFAWKWNGGVFNSCTIQVMLRTPDRC